MHTNDCKLLSLLSLVTPHLFVIKTRLDSATEEGFRYVEHQDAKISVFKNAELFRVFANWVTYRYKIVDTF